MAELSFTDIFDRPARVSATLAQGRTLDVVLLGLAAGGLLVGAAAASESIRAFSGAGYAPHVWKRMLFALQVVAVLGPISTLIGLFLDLGPTLRIAAVSQVVASMAAACAVVLTLPLVLYVEALFGNGLSWCFGEVLPIVFLGAFAAFQRRQFAAYGAESTARLLAGAGFVVALVIHLRLVISV